MFSSTGIPDFSIALFEKQSGNSNELKIGDRHIEDLSRQSIAVFKDLLK